MSRAPQGVTWDGSADLAGKPLTKAEVRVLRVLASGRAGTSDIQRTLGLSEYTVRQHIHRIIQKLGAHDRSMIVQRYMRSEQFKSAYPTDWLGV